MLFFLVQPVAYPASDGFKLESLDYPIVVVSDDPEYGGVILELLNKSFRHFATVTGIQTFAPMQFRFVLDEVAPKEVSQEMERLSYFRTVNLGEKKEFVVEVQSRDFNPIALVRTAMICQLDAYVLNHIKAPLGNQMKEVPFWLVEGLTQGCLVQKIPNLEKIIDRIDRKGPVPSLTTIQEWKELSPHRLEQWWQEACSYWLVKKATAKQADREALAQWLVQWFTPEAQAYWEVSDANERWWRKVLGDKVRPKQPISGEEQTRKDLQKALEFQAVIHGETVPRDFNLGNLPKPPLEFATATPFEEVNNRLLLLQTRGNNLWQEVITSYRSAYALWLKGNYTGYQKEIAKAEQLAQNVVEYMGKTREYLDWYEVNHPANGPRFSALLSQSLDLQDKRDLERRNQAGIAAKLTLIESGR